MYELFDVFNGRVISRHKSREAAEKANVKFQKAVKKANGARSYIPVRIQPTADTRPSELSEVVR